MDSLSNLSDVMLVFAVGLMLSVIMHYQVNIVPESTAGNEAAAEEQISTEDAETFTEEEREQMRSDATEAGLSESMEKTGEIYYDAETDTYYIVENRSGAE